ncbi:MAG: tetraacyldisaccharide 4'-kinase, partial [Verrucomicrobia bacterium]|nr:tetraacyldisaccharide 4'-kinase [Verrucomicrobiota bacterium]
MADGRFKDWMEDLEKFAAEVIYEKGRGKHASLFRGLLFLLSKIFGCLVQVRLFLYQKRIFRDRALGCLVISVGNLTVGGTGKTPVVEKI